MKIEGIGIVKDGQFRAVSSKWFNEQLNSLPEGRYRITVDTYRRRKSNPQLGYYYKVILPHFHRAALDAGWEFATIDELDNYLKSMFASKDIINKHTAEVLTIPGLKRDMTAIEMSTFTDAIKEYAQEFLNYTIPDPLQQTELNL